MQRALFWFCTVLIAVVFAGVTALAAEERKGAPGSTTPPAGPARKAPSSPTAPGTGPTPGVSSVQPLTAPIQMVPSKVKKLSKPEPPLVESKQVVEAYEVWKNHKGSLGTNMNTLKNRQQHCSTKNYSVQEQQATGCKGSDTLDQCMEKLYDQCVFLYMTQAIQVGLEHQLAAARKLAQTAQAHANYIEHFKHWIKTHGK